MVGNDVVDLADAEVRNSPLHPRFDQRVFSALERQALQRSGAFQGNGAIQESAAFQGNAAPDRLRWILWAAKEAAYKLRKQSDPSIIFSPSRFEVSLDDTLRGVVEHEGERLRVEVSVIGDLVHAIATPPGSGSEIVTGVETSEHPNASRAVRTLTVRSLARRLGLPESGLRVLRAGRVPHLQVVGRNRRLDLSLSHHGRYVAFACDLGDTA